MMVMTMVSKMRRNPGCRCRRGGVDVGVEAVVTDQRHTKTETGQIKSMSEKLGQNERSKVVFQKLSKIGGGLGGVFEDCC
jgi:uncharacterized membrane-anchored protein